MKKGVFAVLFLICLMLVGINNTIDLHQQQSSGENLEIHTEILDVIELSQLGYEGSNIYAIRAVAEEGLKNLYCYGVDGGGKHYNLLSSYTAVKGTSERPYLVIYQDYYVVNGGEKVPVTGEGYANSAYYGSVRCELYLLKGGDGGKEIANWY